jgi:integrase
MIKQFFTQPKVLRRLQEGLVAYLKRARPASSHRELFLRWKAPFRPLRRSVSICTLIQKLLRRAGVSVHRPGAHVLRHSLAARYQLITAIARECHKFAPEGEVCS